MVRWLAKMSLRMITGVGVGVGGAGVGVGGTGVAVEGTAVGAGWAIGAAGDNEAQEKDETEDGIEAGHAHQDKTRLPEARLDPYCSHDGFAGLTRVPPPRKGRPRDGG